MKDYSVLVGSHQEVEDQIVQPGLRPPLNSCNSIPQSIQIGDNKWKLVGRGVRFAVYSNGHEVTKLPLCPAQLIDDRKSANYPFQTTAEAVHQYWANISSIREVQRRLLNGILPAHLLGHPTIRKDGSIVQGRLTPLGNLLGISTELDIRGFVDGVVDCIRIMVRRGYMSPFFALPIDYAVHSNGYIVMIGLGSPLFDKDAALRELGRKPWHTHVSGVHLMPTPERTYYIAQMELALTSAIVSREWASDLHTMEY